MNNYKQNMAYKAAKTIMKKAEAFDLIKNKRVDVDLFYTVVRDENQTDALWAYNFWQENENEITQEEFDLLKEVLL